VKNNGAVWGFFSGNNNPLVTILITILAISALSVVIYLFLKIGSDKILEALALSFIAGGAIGNIIDRIFLGYVVDFIEIYIKKYRWPTFNIADSFISIGIVLLLFSIFIERKKGEEKTGDK
jgi:signal peptidase II